MYTRDIKLSFPNDNIKKFTFSIFTLYVTVLTIFEKYDPFYIYMGERESMIDAGKSINHLLILVFKWTSGD